MNKITYEDRKSVYAKALSTWGMEAQAFMAIEEMAELTKELCKLRRGGDARNGLADEIADVTIMLEQLREMFGINDFVCARMDYKIERLAKRLETEAVHE